MTDQSTFRRLQQWYLHQCNGDWEHGYGIHITTIDNPGWLIDINIEDTDAESLAFEKIKIERTEEIGRAHV